MLELVPWHASNGTESVYRCHVIKRSIVKFKNISYLAMVFGCIVTELPMEPITGIFSDNILQPPAPKALRGNTNKCATKCAQNKYLLCTSTLLPAPLGMSITFTLVCKRYNSSSSILIYLIYRCSCHLIISYSSESIIGLWFYCQNIFVSSFSHVNNIFDLTTHC